MDVWKIAIHTSSEAVDAVSVILEELGVIAVDVQDRLDIEIKKQQLKFGELLDEARIDAPAAGAVVSGYLDCAQYDENRLQQFIAGLRKELTRIPASGLVPGPLAIQAALLREDDYLHAWKKDFHVIEVSPRLAIVPAWEKAFWQGRDGQSPLFVEPGVAFGTGTHESTLLCLKELERIVAAGARVLDVGTGTGILAIAAAKLGASRVLALDLDDTAVRVAKQNVRDNAVDDVVAVLPSDLDAAAGTEMFDVVLANLLAGLVIRLVPGVKRHLQPGGRLVASGIVRNQWEEVRAVLEQHRFRIEQVSAASDWVAVRARWEG